MVGIMATSPRDKAINLHNSIKLAMDIPSKLHNLRQLKDILMNRDPSLVPEFVPLLVELQFDCTSPTRRFLAELIGEIGLKHVRFLPEIVPVLISFLNDDTPAVARQAITCGMELFRDILEKVTVQGLYAGQLDISVQSAWIWILKFKEAVYEIAFQPGSDGVRLLAVKFFEALVLLFTPDPNGSSRPPPQQDSDGKIVEFNISWLNGGHPVLNARELAIEASRNLGLLLDQLRSPLVKMLSNSVITVLINSLSAIARRRPTFYGRILPVLLGLDRSNLMTKGVQGSTVYLALKNGFLSCLRSTHPGAAPWRDRLVDALKTMNAGEMAEQALLQVDELPKTMGSDFGEAQPMKEMKTSTEEFDTVHIDTGRKRFVAQEISDRAQDDGTSGKRVKPTIGSDGSNLDFVSDHFSLIGTSLSGDGDSGPVQQLVAMFGALVAQGEKAVDSLEILISSTSSDLLAEVVMANMRHLPASRPNSEDDEEVTLNTTSLSSLVSNNNSLQALSSVSDIQSLSSAFPQIASFLGAQPLASNDISNLDSMEELPKEVLTDKALVPCDRNVPTIVLDPSALVIPSVRERDSSALVIPSVRERDSLTISPDINGIWNSQSGIPGLDNAEYVDGMQDTVDVSQSSSADPVGTYHEQVTSSGGTLSLDRSEALSPKATGTEASCTSSTVSTSVVLSTEYLSQKMPLPILSLTDQQKDHLQKLVFVRIIEAYKQLAVAGGSDIRFYLLAYFGVEYPLELDSIGVLRYHILSDYINHEGHELTLRILYRLFREAEQENDFLLSTSATSIYETFLLTVAETLRDSLPASDKSLSRLFSEVPYLPAPAFKLLEGLCSPGKNEKYDKESHNGDRVTQGLSAVWNLIILRPPIRDACLKIALQSAVHHLEEVRMKAIRLVANKLYPLPIIAQRIEDFANEMLLSVANASHSREGMDAEVSTNVTEKDLNLERLPNGGNPLREANVTGGEVPTVNNQLVSAENASSSSVSEAQRCMSLYFALCTKKHSLLRQVFVVYKSTMPAVKQAVHRHIPILVRTIGSSPELLAIISDPPVGSEMLLMQVLHTLTDGTTPSPDLISTVRRLYDSKLKDAQILIPILPSLSKDEVLPIFPQLVDLPLDKFQAALARILQGSSHKGPSLSPAEVLIAIHGIDLERDGIPLKKVTDACSACFEQRGVFTQQVLAKVLNQLVEQIPLPLLFMRTVIQAIGAFPGLVDFIMEILLRLVSKQIWRFPKLWVGFLKCAFQTKPQSFNVLLQLPAIQLENALSRIPALRAPLTSHANQPNIRATLPRSSLAVLGLAPDSQTSSQAHTTQTADTSNSVAEAAATTNSGAEAAAGETTQELVASS